MKKKIIAIDQGTTSSRAVLFDEEGSLLASEQKEFSQFFPSNGWVEHDPEEIWASVSKVIIDLKRKNSIQDDEIASIGIANQRETTLLWDRRTGKAIYPAIVWQDRRTAKFCEELRTDFVEDEIKEKTGLLIDPYFSATKLSWLFNNIDGIRKKADKGELAFGTIDSFLIWRLTGGKVHKTEATNASRTMLFNIKENNWDKDLLKLFKLPESIFPEVCDSAHNFGETALFGGRISIGGVAGDQQAALIGQCCFDQGDAKSTYGTGCFLLLNTGKNIVLSKNKLLTTIAYRIEGKTTYGIEGSVFVAGSSIQWLRDKLGFFEDAKETENIIRSAKRNLKVFVVPAFTGLGAPHWNPDARGAIYGLTRDAGIPEITLATLQSVAFQTKDLVIAMKKDGAELEELSVDGGMVSNSRFVQELSNTLNLNILKPKFIETTSRGAALLAGLQAGIFENLDEIKKNWQPEKIFRPDKDEVVFMEKKYKDWLVAVKRTSDFL